MPPLLVIPSGSCPRRGALACRLVGVLALLATGGCTLLLDAPNPAGGRADAGPPGIDATVPADAGRDSDVPDANASDTGLDANAPDTGPPDAGQMVPLDCPEDLVGVLFCDGFEDGFSGWITQQADGASLDLLEEGAFRGNQTLTAVSTRTGLGNAIATGAFEGDEPVIWARAFLYIESTASYDIFTVFKLAGTGEAFDTTDISVQGGATPFAHLYARSADGGETGIRDVVPLLTQTWTCLELEVQDNASEMTVRMHVDERLAQTLSMPPQQTPMERVGVGLHFLVDTQPPVSIRMDSVLVSNRRIGCY